MKADKFPATFPVCQSRKLDTNTRYDPRHEVFNFLGALPRAMEILFIRTVAIGTQFPLLYPIFIPLVVILSIGIYFIPISS